MVGLTRAVERRGGRDGMGRGLRVGPVWSRLGGLGREGGEGGERVLRLGVVDDE